VPAYSRRAVPLRAVPTATTVAHLFAPVRFQRPKKIHPRRILPYVREGEERNVHSTTRQASFQAPAAAPAGGLKLLIDTPLTEPGHQRTASNVGEPSVAVYGDVVLFTGNWYSAISTDGGKTFLYIDPTSTQRPTDPPGVTFCCDQVAHYIPSIDTFVWLLQYGPDTGNNIQRLGFAKTADVASGKWQFFDITTDIAEAPGAFMDFPDLAAGANCLYVTTNLFFPDNRVGSAVFRIGFDSIAAAKPLVDTYLSTDFQSFRVAQNCGTTAYFAAHEDTSTLRVFTWPETDAQPASAPVGVARWIGGNAGYISRTPDGRRWLDRADSRITGATLAGNELWFAWSVDRGSNQRPRPFIQIARITTNGLSLIDNINVFDSQSATAYPALSTNTANEVGISYMLGGGPAYPTHVVGIVSGTQQNLVVAASGRGPLPDSQSGRFQWGDYLTVRRFPPADKLFAATGYTLAGAQDGDNLDATPRYVVFGHAADVDTFAASGTVVSGPTVTPAASGGPISDVNTLPTVSPKAAAAIKKACGITGTTPHAAAAAALPPPLLQLVTSPGQERWPVKTGTDDDVALVGKNVIGGHDYGAGIVDTTVEELARVPRPSSMPNIHVDPPGFLNKRAQPVETTIWRIEATIFALKLEKDGDYHLALNGAGGKQMIAEVPTPTKRFIDDSPWMENIKAARKMVDDRFVSKLSPADFVPLDGVLVPRESLSPEVQAAMQPGALPRSFVAAEHEAVGMPVFQTAVKPTKVRITGVGFFDRVHGQIGVSPTNGIELHPVLKIEWL
jgi:hypothetical protein